MPKVGCFWPGLFKSSNCLFPWAARETGKRSSFCAAIHISVPESELEMMASPSLLRPPLGGCAAWLCSTKTRCHPGTSPQGGLPQIFLVNLFFSFSPPYLGTLNTPWQDTLHSPPKPTLPARSGHAPGAPPITHPGEASPAS